MRDKKGKVIKNLETLTAKKAVEETTIEETTIEETKTEEKLNMLGGQLVSRKKNLKNPVIGICFDGAGNELGQISLKRDGFIRGESAADVPIDIFLVGTDANKETLVLDQKRNEIGRKVNPFKSMRAQAGQNLTCPAGTVPAGTTTIKLSINIESLWD